MLVSDVGARAVSGVPPVARTLLRSHAHCYLWIAPSRQVTLALFAVAPLLAISTLMIIKITSSQTARSNESYAKAGSVVSTTVRSIRTILSLNAVEDMIARFKAATLEACEISRGSAVSLGTANGFNVVSMVLSYMIVTMFGVRCLQLAMPSL
jgi:ABC-type bacteriocin/lantibiotic exporter with double-glycine peptidase domain